MDKITSCHVATFHAGLVLWRCISAMAMGQNAKKSRPCKDLQKQIVKRCWTACSDLHTKKERLCASPDYVWKQKKRAVCLEKFAGFPEISELDSQISSEN